MALCTEIITKVTPTPTSLYFAFSSPGGNVAAGITLYNFLRGLPVDVFMHNTGSVNSIATAIFMAADQRYACSHSRFLFHGVATGFSQPVSLGSSQLRELLSGLEEDEARIQELLVERSNLSIGEVSGLFRQGETKNPTFALEKGVIHDIRDFSIPAGSKIVSANFQ